MEDRGVIDATRGPEVRLRLFCFPYAAGSAYVFRSWLKSFSHGVDVCPVHLPGRGRRLAETRHTRLDTLLAGLLEDLEPYLDVPFALFGHSMGAVVVFELARKLLQKGRPAAWLFVSGRSAPHLSRCQVPRHVLPDEEFIRELRNLAGTPDEILRDPKLMELMLPVLRADFAICENYLYQEGSILPCPISAFGGLQDREVARERLLGWRHHTSASFEAHFFPGGHFFLHESETEVIATVRRALSPLSGDLPAFTR